MKLLLLPALVFSFAINALADSATWSPNPAGGDWNVAANWDPATIPNGPDDTATFSASSVQNVFLSSNVELDSIVFATGSPSYEITVGASLSLVLSGAGIVSSANPSNFIAASDSDGGHGTILFSGRAAAGTASFTNEANPVPDQESGMTLFTQMSSGGDASIINRGSVVAGGSAGTTMFSESASGSFAKIVNEGSSISGGVGGVTLFEGHSRIPGSDITALGGSNGGGGGRIILADNSQGDSFANVILSGNGSLDLSQRHSDITIGALEGDGGVVSLGRTQLLIDIYSDSVFAGVIEDGGLGGGLHGSIALSTESGFGSLTLRGANTYSGGTTLDNATLLIGNQSGSATGAGTVQVNSGTLGGDGKIGGAVIIGSGSGDSGYLAPGVSGPGRLLIHKTLTFKADGIYSCDVDAKNTRLDQVRAGGFTIESGAQIFINSVSSQALPAGTVLTVFENTSDSPISGTFADLADGSTVHAAGNAFRVSYEGGDGNDLTLTVMP